jgi:hypothetical protein
MHAVRLGLCWKVKVSQREIPLALCGSGLIIAAALYFGAIWLREQGSRGMQTTKSANDRESYPDVERFARRIA